MGWVEFIKEFEDEIWVIYRYSHDCRDYDGTVKINKSTVSDEIENLIFEIIKSNSDWENCKFAYSVVLYVYKSLQNNQQLPEKHMLAYG